MPQTCSILAGALQMLVADHQVVEALHFERQVIEPGARRLETQERVVIDEGLAAVAAIEGRDDVVACVRRRPRRSSTKPNISRYQRILSFAFGVISTACAMRLTCDGPALEAHQLAARGAASPRPS